MLYGIRSNGKAHGVVMTDVKVVEFMLNLSGYTPDKDLSKFKVLDPAGGNGVFILECIKRLFQSSVKFKFNFQESLDNLRICEISDKYSKTIKQNIWELIKTYNVRTKSVIDTMVIHDDFLMHVFPLFDLIVGNPPYVRYENIPPKMKEFYRKQYDTFRYRSDLYIPFFEKGLNLLNKKGEMCYICSNRWMKNQYGIELRKKIINDFSVPFIINLENIKAFNENVYGYPSIVLITKKKRKNSKYNIVTNFSELGNLTQEIKKSKYILKYPLKAEPWIFNDSTNKFGKKLSLIEEQGFKIGIGVATGADKIFIQKKFNNIIEKELLLPLVKTEDIKNGYIEWKGNYLLNPYQPNSNKLIRLNELPKAKDYLNKNKLQLKMRHTAKKNPAKWYKTIDPIYPELVSKPKLLLPDIKKKQIIAFDKGEYYVHHNIYYITGNNVENLKILGSLLMSNFVQKQLEEISVTMSGGYLRWQAQNLRRIKIPIISLLPNKMKNDLIKAFNKKNISKINNLFNEFQIMMRNDK